MSHLVEFEALLESYDEGSFTARLVPFGVEAPYGSGSVEFAMGSLDYTSSTPLTVDHGDSVFDRIGVMVRHFETKDAAFGEFQLSDTDAGRTMRTLLLDGAVTDVSVGVRVDNDVDGVMVGELDHVSLVSHGRFGRTENPSKILAVHDDKEPFMGEEKVEEALVVEQFDDSELKAEMMRLSEHIDTLENRVVDEPELFESLGDFIKTDTLANLGDEDAVDKMALFADQNTTTTAAGVVPDFLSSEVLSIIATTRPFIQNIPSDPIGEAGMTVVYPEVTAKGTVAKQAAEFDPVASSPVTIGTKSVPLFTYAGANSISQQLIVRSAPSFVPILLAELAGQYAEITEKDSGDTAVAAAGGTAVLADLGADASATFAALNLASTAIIAGVRRPADTVFLAADRWAQINSLIDTDGRPLLVFPPNNPSNAQGQSGFDVTVAQYHGWTLRLSADLTTGTCLIAATGKSATNLEMNPTQLSALQVGTLSTDIGIWGLQNVAIKYPDGLYTLTLV